MDQATEALSNKKHYEAQDAKLTIAGKEIIGEPNDFDAGDKPPAIYIDGEIKIGERGFLAVMDNGTITAPTRKELRTRIASLLANEAYSEDKGPIEIYRVTRLPLARKVDFKF
jgi:hypothetical protein